MQRFLALALLLFMFNSVAFAFDLPWSDAAKQKRLQKQQEKETEPMVQTVEEWLERATDIKMEHRISEPYKEEANPNLVEKLEWPSVFEKYNVNPGSREFNLETLMKDKSTRSQGVISPDFKLMAYTECYYHPSNQQTGSAFYIYPLDTSKGKKRRVLDANVFAGAKKTPLIASSNEELRQYLFSSLTVVDWSKDSKKVLLKEKTGSSLDGIYQTVVWLYSTEDGSAKKFDDLNNIIKEYWFQKDKLNLNRYRWDIKPLGFLVSDNNIVLCAAHTYDKKHKEHIFLGMWGINTLTGEVLLMSDTVADSFEIEANGLILNKHLP